MNKLLTYIVLAGFWITFGLTSLLQVNQNYADQKYRLIAGLLELSGGLGFLAIGFYRKSKGQLK